MEPEGRRKTLALVRAYSEQHNAAVLLATHGIGEAEDVCDRVSVLKDGVLRKGGVPTRLRAHAAHEFFLVTMSFSVAEGELNLERRRAKAKAFIYGLAFYRVELEERCRLIYSLDARRVDPVAVWCTLFDEFYLGGVVDTFSFSRHGLHEVVSFALSQSDVSDRNSWGTAKPETGEQ
jgi:energy-coupling factor transporter ATP-binding protein EcfA2